MSFELDAWQKEVLEAEGNIALRSGRQVGKSTVIAIKAAEFAAKNPFKTVLIVSSVERQAYLLFEKTYAHIFDYHKSLIKKGKDRPTKHIITLNNGSKIMSFPCGLDGHGIRGYTCDMIIFDEAAFIPNEVFISVIPALMTKKTRIILLSTPFGREGYFYDCFQDESFKTFHISSLDCPRANKEFLEREKARLTKCQFAQEYLGEFVSELSRYFNEELIKNCMVLDRSVSIPPQNNTPLRFPIQDAFLGVDIAQLGTDESVFITVERINHEKIKQIDMELTEKTRLTDTIQRIKELDKIYKYRQIFIDDGGVGAGVFDVLLKDDQTKNKVIAINNSARPLNRDETRKKKILKEDLYSNLLQLMESGKIKLFKDNNLAASLRSIQYEYDEGRLKIFGNYSHCTESLVRAVWCIQNKHLNIWCR